MNMLLVSMVLDLPVTQQQVMLFDRFPDGPYHELIQKAYSPNHPLVRPEKYKHKKVSYCSGC